MRQEQLKKRSLERVHSAPLRMSSVVPLDQDPLSAAQQQQGFGLVALWALGFGW